MLLRSFFLLIVNIAIGMISLVLILGEGTYWRLNLIDNLYKLTQTNPGDVFITVFIVEFVLIWGLGGLWIMGFYGQIWNLLKRLS
jgi:hypothetical protein